MLIRSIKVAINEHLIIKKELNAGLTEKQKETFEKFKECTSELYCITEREAFSSGFILATRIMVEVMEGSGTVEEI